MLAPLVVFSLTVLLLPLCISGLLRHGVVDVPNERSSHSRPTPRGGGAATSVAIAVGLAIAAGIGEVRMPLLAALVLFGLVGLAEDLVGVPALWRLAYQVAASLGIVAWIFLDRPPPSPAPVTATVVVLAVIFLVSYVNSFNFMDGIDGISALQILTVGAYWSLLGLKLGADSFATGAALLAAAAAAFLPFNLPRARVFLGDAGSYTFGACVAILALIGSRQGIPPEALYAPLVIYAADTASTLLRRVRRGDSWYQPHREHVYQQLVAMGWSHTTTAVVVGAATLVCASLGAVSLEDALVVRTLAGAGVLGVVVAYLALPGAVRRSRSGPPQGLAA